MGENYEQEVVSNEDHCGCVCIEKYYCLTQILTGHRCLKLYTERIGKEGYDEFVYSGDGV